MYRYILLFLLFNIYLSDCSAQNLVPNHSFEDTIFCPNGGGQIDFATGWINFNGTPDYFNSCAACSNPLGCFGIPGNVWGSQQAFTGNAYAGIATYYEQFQYREIVGAQLLQPLVPGNKYFVSFYVSRAGGYLFLPYHKLNVTIFPNPFNNKLTFEYESNEVLEITIYDFSLKKIINQKFTGSLTLNSSEFKNGIYFYKINNKNGKTESGEIVKL